MSREKAPVLGGALKVFETFLAQWKDMANLPNAPHLSAFLKEGISWANKYHKRMREKNTYVYAMCKFSLFSYV